MGKRPSWWPDVEADIDRLLHGFTDDLRKKLTADPLGILRRKNPFLFRVRAGDDAHELTRMVIDAYLSSSEETKFGNIMEEIAISICGHAKGGAKSAAEAIDLEYDEGNQRTIIQIKSGPNWGNSSQRQKLVDNFRSAQRRLRQTGVTARCIEGICYGRSGEKDLGTHVQLIGRAFWDDISGRSDTDWLVLQALGKHADNGLNAPREEANERMLEILKRYGAVHNGKIDWNKLLRLAMDQRKEPWVNLRANDNADGSH